MHKPDRIRALVVALIVFSLYVDLANILTSLALASLPLETVGSVWVGSTAIVTLTLFDAVILNLYFIRQRKRARTSPSLQYKQEPVTPATLFPELSSLHLGNTDLTPL